MERIFKKRTKFMENLIICKRCGKCCGKCRYLVRHGSLFTSCRIYPNRLGTIIKKNDEYIELCEDRNPKIFIEGCPYNERKNLH